MGFNSEFKGLIDVLDENINTLYKSILDHSVMYQATHFKSKTH